MGVHQLWGILEPVKQEQNVSSLVGKTLCVDLSGWICEAQCAKGLKASVNKPHLRNIFFRVANLKRHGVGLVFVVDGKAPELKWEAMAKRVQSRYGAALQKSTKSKRQKKIGRSNFTVWVNECKTLLKLLGVPCVESPGEAEAMCAWLDYNQMVDGCITNDGDAFLYGARTVYKDFSVSAKESFLECYKMEDVEAQLNPQDSILDSRSEKTNVASTTGLDRRNLVALALLLGCDYLPQGVAGVGREIALKLMAALKGVDLLNRFQQWKTDASLSNELSGIERAVKKKALDDRHFPSQEVINEFLSKKMYPKSVRTKAVCANLASLQEFCLKYLEWPQDYTTEKVLPLITYWQMDNMDPRQTASPCTQVVRPQGILKERVQMKVECYEVLWQNVSLGNTCSSSFVTIETRKLFKERFPAVVEKFENQRRLKQTKQGKGKRKKDNIAASAANLSEDEVEVLAVGMSSLSVADKVESRRCGCLPDMEPGFTNGAQIAENVFDDTKYGLDESPGFKVKELTTNVPEYAEDGTDVQDFSSAKDCNGAAEENDDDSFSFPSLAERLSKKVNLCSIYTTSSEVKKGMDGNLSGNAMEETNKVIASETTCESMEKNNNKIKHSQNTQTKLPTSVQDSVNITCHLLQQPEETSVAEETEKLVNSFTSPKRQLMKPLSNNCDVQNFKDNLSYVTTVEKLCNGDVIEVIELISPGKTAISPFTSTKGDSEDHNFQVSDVEQETWQQSKELFFSIPKETTHFMYSETKPLVELLGDPAQSEGKHPITRTVTEALFVSPFKERFENEGSNISSSSVDEVFAESPLKDDGVFAVSSLRERLTERMEKKKLYSLHSDNFLLVDSNSVNLKHSVTELGEEKSNQKNFSGNSKNKEAVSKEKKSSGKGKEKENIGRIIQENKNAFVDMPQSEKSNIVQEKKRVRKKRIPRSQRKSCTDSPQEVDAFQKKHVKDDNNLRK